MGKGVIAGGLGTAAMTLYQTAVAKARESEPSTVPADMAKRVVRGVLEREVSDEHTEALNNVMHWSYGTSWGVPLAIVQASARKRPVPAGLAFGALLWAVSLVELPLMKLAPPPWESPPQELALDASYHLVYGCAAAAALVALRLA